MSQLDVSRAYHKWQHWTLAENEKDKQQKHFGTTNLFNILDRLARR